MNKIYKAVRFICICVFLICIGCVIGFSFITKLQTEKVYAMSHKKVLRNESIDAMIQEISNSGILLQTAQGEAIVYSKTEISSESVPLTDIYTEAGSTVDFRCYDPLAESYAWEIYNAQGWEEAIAIETMDELQRNVSLLTVEATANMMVKCTLHYPDKEEVQTASLYVLNHVKDVSFDDIVSVSSNTYVSTRDLPVKITYEDGSSESIAGLNNLYYVKSEEKITWDNTISGNRVETTTITLTECNYLKIGLEEQRALFRYYPTDNEMIEISSIVSGLDNVPPVITDVLISPYEIRNVDEAVPLTITVVAEDNETLPIQLEYAFVISDREPEEADWSSNSSFDMDITQNGTYIAYVRDTSGNIATQEKDIITVDLKAPVITSVTLSTETGWCRTNTIIVEARDAGEMSYCFTNKSGGTSSDWITYSEYAADSNGTWIIQVKDSAGNISEAEIVINNIDKESPVIRSIRVKQEEN